LYGRKASEFRHRADDSEHQHVELRIPPIITPERQLALFERLEASRIPRQSHCPPRFYLLGGGRITSPCGRHFQGVNRIDTGRRKYHCPGRTLYLDDTCHCRPLDAETMEEVVWGSVTKLLTDPAALARCRPGDRLTLVGPEPSLDELIDAAHRRVAEAEGALAHAAVELVQARLPGQAIGAATRELQRSLDEAVANRDNLLQRRRDATDVGRLKRLQHDVDILSAHLNHLTPPQRRAVLDMLAVKVTVTAWTTCRLCRGKGQLRGGRAGQQCPACVGCRRLPRAERHVLVGGRRVRSARRHPPDALGD
jgi:hypothetical protein